MGNCEDAIPALTTQIWVDFGCVKLLKNDRPCVLNSQGSIALFYAPDFGIFLAIFVVGFRLN